MNEKMSYLPRSTVPSAAELFVLLPLLLLLLLLFELLLKLLITPNVYLVKKAPNESIHL